MKRSADGLWSGATEAKEGQHPFGTDPDDVVQKADALLSGDTRHAKPRVDRHDLPLPVRTERFGSLRIPGGPET